MNVVGVMHVTHLITFRFAAFSAVGAGGFILIAADRVVYRRLPWCGSTR